MKITKKVREEAALICAIAASTPGMDSSYGSVCRALHGDGWRKYGNKTFSLAIDAWRECHDVVELDDVDAEAESLLRSGWSPGDEP